MSALEPTTNLTTTTPILPEQRRSAGCFSYPSPYRTGRRCILSNNHALANANAANIGDPIMQPGPHDNTPSNQARRIARLTEYEPFVFGSPVCCFAARRDSFAASKSSSLPTTTRPCDDRENSIDHNHCAEVLVEYLRVIGKEGTPC